MPGAVGKFRAGKGGRIKFGATFCKLRKWSASYKGNEQDTTNFESFTTDFGSSGIGSAGRAFTQGLICTEEADISCDGHWDAARNPFDNPPGIYVRDDGPQLDLILDRTDNTFYRFYATRILTADVENDSASVITFKFSAKNQGPFLLPAGSV